MFIYESSKGYLFTKDKKLAANKLKDGEEIKSLLGEADTAEQCWNLIRSEVDINHSGGWDKKYVKEIIQDWFDEDISDLIKEEEKIRPKAIDLHD